MAFSGQARQSRESGFEISLDTLEFGIMLNPTAMRVMKTLHRQDEIFLALDLGRKKQLTVSFSYGSTTTTSRKPRQYKIALDIFIIKKILQSVDGDGMQQFVIPLTHPPKYFRRVKSSSRDVTKPKHFDAQWQRATDIVRNRHGMSGQAISLHEEVGEDDYINIGRWTTFRFTVKPGPTASRFCDAFRTAMTNSNVDLQLGCELDFNSDAPSVWSYLDHPVAAKAGQPSSLLNLPAVVHLDDMVRYQLEVCISRGILNEYTISVDFLQRLATLDRKDATRRLEYLTDQGTILFDPIQLFDMEDAQFYEPNVRVPSYCALIRRASITPTTILFASPTIETSNRVTRWNRNLQDRYLRIQFIEEAELDRIQSNGYKDSEDLGRRLKRALYEGIRIGDRVYEFLAFGSSQLRQASAYFFCPTSHVSCNDIRSWMGQLDHIRVVAKYAARLGQCFSTTREIRGIHAPEIKYVKDIERNGHCFSDGVGLISGFLAKTITQEMTLDVNSDPTAFQFRMGGCKGVLVVWPQVKWNEVHVRGSQEKFKSESRNLEVIRCATNPTATLNRQTIPLLEYLGVTKEKFLSLLEDQIESYENAARHTSAAIDLLTKFVDQQQSSLILAELLKANFQTDDFEEPFVATLLHLWISWSFRLLKEKARIHVTKSAFVLGCVDETGTLRGHSSKTEGCDDKDINKLPQIFLQLTDHKRYNLKTIVRGICLVGRNPSLHPGDIRVVQAVDNPSLRHLTNVVVFPSTGDCPVPSMLSGGDLDGDDFFVIWDPDMIPTRWNHPPMDHEGSKPRELSQDVTVNDLREFFVNYLKNDSLGLIATAHLGNADDLGPGSQKCLELAELHSKAVDYPKTGEAAVMSPNLQPSRWPHFMEKRSSYRSHKALGVIYDEVVKHTVDFRPRQAHTFDKRVLGRFCHEKEILDQARSIKNQYDIAVCRLLSQYNVKTEFELYTGWAMSKPRVGSDYKRQEDLGLEYDALKQNVRELCYQAIKDKDDDDESLEKFVAAMYKVTEEEVKAAQHNETHVNQNTESHASSMPMISFPWIFHWVMIRLAMGKSYRPGKSVMGAARRVPNPNQRRQYSQEDDQPVTSTTSQNEGLAAVDATVDSAPLLAGPMMDSFIDDRLDDTDDDAHTAKLGSEEDVNTDEKIGQDGGEVESSVDRLAALLGISEE